MSRSRKLPIYKDNGIDRHSRQRRRVRRIIKQAVRNIKHLKNYEEYELPRFRSIINDYDWCDYVLDYRKHFNLLTRGYTTVEEFNEYSSKLGRK